MANWLFHVFGGDICLLTEVNLDRVSTADYLWRGTFWELKTVTTEKSANGAIRHGLKQIYENPGGIILDYRGHKIKLETFQDVIRKRLWWVENHPSLDVMIILDENHVRVWRYPKEE